MSNIIARASDSVASNSSPIIYNIAYDATCNIVAGTVASFLIELPMLACTSAEKNNLPRRNITGMAFGIDLHEFSIFSHSDKYSIKVFTRNDISLSDTFLEVLSYEDINKSILDSFDGELYIRNYDFTGPYGGQTNNLYFLVDNTTGTVDTGMINIVLSYSVTQDKSVIG
jgi:hypothetical protein